MTEKARLRSGPFKGMDVTCAAQDRVTRLRPYVEKVLVALGHPEALVTDESAVGDFFRWDAEDTALAATQSAALRRASARLGVELRYEDLVADVAERLQGGQ